ncbi:IS1595 family transposase [Candidatus Peregrinibacteria bacterium]|nr:IS1595 family transposase [Candidatus Peregrinibacteria bacterium]
MQRQKSLPCPHCGGIEVYRHGRSGQRRIRYRCRYCRKTFCGRTGTARIHSHLSDKEWKDSVRLFSMRGSISGADLARFLGKERKLGQRVNRKLREQMAGLPAAKLNGIVESDETTMTRQWVWGAVCRDSGQLVLRQVLRRDENTLLPLITNYTTKESHLFTDEWLGYRNLLWQRTHMTVNHSKEFVSPFSPQINTNRQEGVWSLFKPMAVHTYRGIPKRFLKNYLKEFMFRYNLKSYRHRVAALNYYLSFNFHTLWV